MADIQNQLSKDVPAADGDGGASLADAWGSGDERVVSRVLEEISVLFAARLHHKYDLACDECDDLVTYAIGKAWHQHADFDPSRGRLVAWLCVRRQLEFPFSDNYTTRGQE